jgi:hypothetical protein
MNKRQVLERLGSMSEWEASAAISFGLIHVAAGDCLGQGQPFGSVAYSNMQLFHETSARHLAEAFALRMPQKRDYEAVMKHKTKVAFIAETLFFMVIPELIPEGGLSGAKSTNANSPTGRGRKTYEDGIEISGIVL